MCLLVGCGADEESGRPGGPRGGTNGAVGEFGNAPKTAAESNAEAGNGASGACESVRLIAQPSTPDMLIVLDRSGSMGVEGRWQPSVNAVRRVVDGLQSQIRFGLAMFPDPDQTGGAVQIDVTPCLTDPDPFGCLTNLLVDAGGNVDINAALSGACAPGKLVVPVALDNAAAINMALSNTGPSGGTPTPETLQGLLDQFAPVANDPDKVPPARFILLVTDGQPTCPTGNGSITTPEDVDASNRAVEALTERGVSTYVIGYNTSGPGNEAVAAVLDGFATRGGTGDTQHRPVEDEQGLLEQMQNIAGAAVSCTFTLEKAPQRADYVLVQIDGRQVNLDDPNGWSLVGDRTVQLSGAACAMLQSDGSHTIDVAVQCSVVSPI